MKTTQFRRRSTLAVSLASTLALAACGASDSTSSETTVTSPPVSTEAESAPVTAEAEPADPVVADSEAVTTEAESADTVVADTAVPDTAVPDTEASDDSTDTAAMAGYLGSYTLDDAEFGTMTTVTVEGDTRTIVTNALPDHETGEFPNDGNPSTISAQDLTYEYSTEGTFVGSETAVRTTGASVNGVKLEPGTNETVACESGETLRVEALQDIYDLGFDVNNAHVQPTGEYHYHGISELLVDAYSNDEDLVHVGFAADGFLIYYSKTGVYSSSYELSADERVGTGCIGGGALMDITVEIEGSSPDGTYTSDWVFNADGGDLDECNGVEIDGEYAYLITDEWPFIGRCLNGEVTEAGPGGDGPPPGDGDAPADSTDA